MIQGLGKIAGIGLICVCLFITVGGVRKGISDDRGFIAGCRAAHLIALRSAEAGVLARRADFNGFSLLDGDSPGKNCACRKRRGADAHAFQETAPAGAKWIFLWLLLRSE